MADGFQCFDCKFGNHQQHCVTNGEFDVAMVAKTWLNHARLDGVPNNSSKVEELLWAWECINDRVTEAPESAYAFVLECISQAQTKEDASVIAAGPLEELLYKHGEKFIERVDELARKSLRFRYVLSGVWPSKNHPEIHSKITTLQATGPHMDRDDLFPKE